MCPVLVHQNDKNAYTQKVSYVTLICVGGWGLGVLLTKQIQPVHHILGNVTVGYDTNGKATHAYEYILSVMLCVKYRECKEYNENPILK